MVVAKSHSSVAGAEIAIANTAATNALSFGMCWSSTRQNHSSSCCPTVAYWRLGSALRCLAAFVLFTQLVWIDFCFQLPMANFSDSNDRLKWK